MEEKSFIADIDGERADTAAARLSGSSRSLISSLFEKGYVLINGNAAKKSVKLKAGDNLSISFPPEEMPDLTPKNIPFEILLDKEGYAVINKPAGLTVHPAPGNFSDTLVNALLWTFSIQDEDNGFRPGIVHRLDKDTSGVMIIAKNADYRAKLSELFSSRKIKKKYYAICSGAPDFTEKLIDAPIGRNKHNRQKMSVREDGKKAVSRFTVKERYKNAFLAEVEIFTGRTHQIRVHAASIGHPLVGDTLYGGKKLFGFSRQALHSAYLSFEDPSGEFIDISLQMPDDMVALADNLKG